MAGSLKVLVILIIYGLIGVKSQPENPCTQPNYDRCVQDLNPLLEAAGNFYIKYTVDRMREVCSEYVSTKACIQEFEPHCNAATKQELQSRHAYFEYICDDTFSVFEKYRDCLVRPELERRAQSCNGTFFRSISIRGPGRPCGDIKNYLDCLSTEVRTVCGQEAGEWQLGLDKAVLGSHLAAVNCSLDLESQAYCTNENLGRCFRPLEVHPIADGSHIVPTHTMENIVEICKAYTLVRPCVDVIIAECHPNHQRHLRSLHDSYKYVCDDTLEEYFQHRDCLATASLHNQLAGCHSNFEKELQAVDFSSDTAQSKYASLCLHANTMVDCIVGFVQGVCGREAAAWQRGLDIAVYEPALEYFECQIRRIPANATASSRNLNPINLTVGASSRILNPINPTAEAISRSLNPINPKILAAIIIPAAVIIIVLIVALLLICRCIKNKRKESNPHLRMGEQEMGPASPRVVYAVPPPVSTQEQQLGAMAALPPDLLPPEYSEKPQFGEMLLAAAMAYQASGEEVKVPLPPDDDGGYATVAENMATTTRDSVLQPPQYDGPYDDVDLGKGTR